MDLSLFKRNSDYEWEIAPQAGMHVPAVIFASRELIEAMDDKVYQQVTNVARLPGIVKASYAMPDAHRGYGFPIGGVAAFDADEGGVVSAGGVGFDISCGVRCLHTGSSHALIARKGSPTAWSIPAGLGRPADPPVGGDGRDAHRRRGWAVERGWGRADLDRIEEQGTCGRLPGGLRAREETPARRDGHAR